MLIIGCDFHTRFQKIAMMDTTTGELVTRRLEHGTGEAERFYAALAAPVRVGIEATLATQWFEKMLRHYGHELWIGDAAEIRAAMVRKQKTDDRDALHILDLLMQNRFPRIWVPSPAERDVRQLVRHRHKLVRFRTSVMNQLHALAMGQGLCLRKKLWTTVGRQKLESLTLDPWASRRRLGAISKQGNSMLRCLLVEAAQTSARLDPELRRNYQRLKLRRGNSGVATPRGDTFAEKP